MSVARKRALVLLVVVLALLVAVALAWRGVQARRAQQAAQAAAPKETVIDLVPGDLARAQVLTLGTGVPVTGTLVAVNSAVVKARVAGELQGLTVREGDSVQAGQVLARVEPTEYAERLSQAQRQADAARAQLDIAQRQYDTNAALVRQGFISQVALDNSQASLASARANYGAAQHGAEALRKSLADTVLKAPIGGQISQRLVQPGERVAPEARIVEIVDPSRLELQAAFSPADSVALRVGQHATLRVEGVAEPVAATVARINPAAQAGSRSVLAYLSVAPQPGLRQGLFAEGTLATAEQRALAVPLSAVRTDKPAPYVQLAAQGRVVHQGVQPGVRGTVNGETWVAVDGVPEGAVVLRGSTGALREGTAVRLLPAATAALAASAPASVAAGAARP